MERAAEPLAALPPERLAKALAIADFMLGEARHADADAVLASLACRLGDAGLPLDRMTSIVPLLHAEHAASARTWARGRGTRSFTVPFSSAAGTGYDRSPAARSHREKRWIEFWLAETPDEAYGIVPELRADGIVHYVSAPVFWANGMAGSVSFATCATAGFSQGDMAFLRAVFPAIAACQEIRTAHRIMAELVRMYVGDEPHRRILAGDVHRGEVMRLSSAILFADMRGFTELTACMTAEQATRLLNAYYDCVVPEVEAAGGEVLKFIGDGILAVFRAEDGGHAAAASALRAAHGALAEVAARTEAPRFRIGIALHSGEVAFGNVGSGARLDYTVIGSDVNLASRIAALCGALGEPLLVSERFAALCPEAGLTLRGTHALKGLAGRQAVYAPAADRSGG